jgi:hypothetical protein
MILPSDCRASNLSHFQQKTVSVITMHPSVMTCLTDIEISCLTDITVKEGGWILRFRQWSQVTIPMRPFPNTFISMLPGFKASIWRDFRLVHEREQFEKSPSSRPIIRILGPTGVYNISVILCDAFRQSRKSNRIDMRLVRLVAERAYLRVASFSHAHRVTVRVRYVLG